MLVAWGMEGHKWVLTGIGTDPGLDLAYPVVDANTQSIMKVPKQKILYCFGWSKVQVT